MCQKTNPAKGCFLKICTVWCVLFNYILREIYAKTIFVAEIISLFYKLI